MPSQTNTGQSVRAAVVLAALGVVFGDIGTSPIYTVQTVFSPSDPHPVPLNAHNVYGIVSLIFWSIMIIVTLTYVTLVMRADNDGEGGIMALITLLRRWGSETRHRTALILAALGVFGASLFFGDSMITPAISVLSAIEGIEVVDPDFKEWVVPITVGIIVVLFYVQRHGTAIVGRAFGPVMVAWFLAIGACGVTGIVAHPEILKALSPTYALTFIVGHFEIAFFALTAVVLAVTGAEALYADMGHFGRKAITRAWLFVVLPALALNYLGQGALLIGDPATMRAPFFLLIPSWALWPMVLLATAATVIASQAVITGAFSVAAQAARIGYLPRLRVIHTSAAREGQIYVPWINGLLMVGVLTLVLGFRSSERLAYAYGMAVTGTITITLLLFLYYARTRWSAPLWLVVDRRRHPAADRPAVRRGEPDQGRPRRMAAAADRRRRVHRDDHLASRPRDRHRGKGKGRRTARRIHRRDPRLPTAIGARPRHRRLPQPREGDRAACPAHMRRAHPCTAQARHHRVHRNASDAARTGVRTHPVDALGYKKDGIVFVTANYGYMEKTHILDALRSLTPKQSEGRIAIDDASYFLSKLELVRGRKKTMAQWRKRLFIATSYITADAAERFGLPRDRTVIMGSRIEV